MNYQERGLCKSKHFCWFFPNYDNRFLTIDIDLNMKYKQNILLHHAIYSLMATFIGKCGSFFCSSFSIFRKITIKNKKYRIACKNWGNLFLAFWRWLIYQKEPIYGARSWRKIRRWTRRNQTIAIYLATQYFLFLND